MTNNAEIFDAFFRRADTDRDGRISGAEAVAFFQGANLPQVTLAKIWQFADQGRTGYLSRPEFYNALKLVTVGQTGRELSAELVKAALTGPAAAQIPPPRINPPGPSAVYGQVTPRPPSALQGGIGGSAAHPLSSQGSGGPQVLQGQPQGWFPSVGNQMQVQTLPRPVPPTSAVLQPQVPLGSSYAAADSLWPTPRTPSFPSASQFLNSANVAPASNFQSMPTSGTSRPTATPMPTPSTTAHAQDSSGAPGFQATADLFSGGFKATGHGGSSLKIDAGEDFFSPAPPARPPGALAAKSTSALQGFGDSSSLADPVAPLALLPTTLAPTASLGKSPAVSQALPSLSMPQDLGPGLSARVFLGQGPATPWPQMTLNDVQRYMRVFSKVDTDHDGKITGEQARDLFLSWQLPREVLKQVWNLSDQDGDSMLSTREFCTALYFMERFREGRTLPAKLPSHIHLDDWNLPDVPDGPKTGPKLPTDDGETGWQQMQGNSQSTGSGRALGSLPDQSLAGHPELGTQALFSGFNSVKQGHCSETVVPKTKRGDADEAKKKVFEPKDHTMDHKEKAEYYRTKLQEIVLHKSRCDNKLAEITERAAADKREVESLAKKYDEKYRAAADVNTQLAAGEAAYREIQERKTDIFNALVKMEQGGNTNSLLQSRVDRISTDLDELRKALNERAKHLSIEVKEQPAIETPFGWQPGIQEKAALWDENWDKFDEEGLPHLVLLNFEDSVSVPKQAPADLQSAKASVSNGDDSEINKVSRFSLLPDNKAGATHAAKVAAFHGFAGGSSDVGSPQTSSIDETSSPARVFEQNGNSYFDSFSPLAMSKDSRVSSLFGGNTAQSTSLFTSGPSPTKRDDDFAGSFLRFDSFGASEDQATTGSFLNRFNSFNSVRTNKARTGSFHSDDESDLFAGTLSFGATNQDNSDGWKAF
ncbi:unnamed protein product [Sphagnum troendelagicum]|uniref:Uncharacterized protein n=1 Tax=Sphagnum troendelagicum TaxID=128251 RepID=A0ABP0TM80_9BRYO